jgi:hypothetical protein
MFAISVPIFVLMACFGHYGKQVGANTANATLGIERKARESKGDVERVNTRLQDLSVDMALWPLQPPTNIYTGQ